MADGKQREAWSRMSSLCAVVANAAGAKTKPDAFNPYVQRKKVSGQALRDVLRERFVKPYEGQK